MLGLLIAQTWFRSGAAIAGGDVLPPIGTAWIGRIFNTFGWSGDSLGGPVANQNQLPYAAFVELVHFFGGSGALAQRIGLSLLVCGILLAGAGLARSLSMSPLAGAVAAICFFFNPITLTSVGINDVFLLAMILVAALPAVVIAHGRGAVKLWQLSAVFLIAAPFVGFVYANPPLVGMLVFTLLATPLLVWVLFDRTTAARSLSGLLIAGALAGAASSYWLVPALLAQSSVATGTLSSLSAWTFTESRSTLANGFWLNTSWAWNFREYFPYSYLFRQFPISLVRSLIPLLAFAGLTLRSPDKGPTAQSGFIRLAGLLSIFVLGLILLSNGTQAPGSLLFDFLYRLPYGWLLREPGRFLLVAGLGYALLIGLLVDRVHLPLRKLFDKTPQNITGKSNFSASSWLAMGAVVVALASAFPLWTGSVVSGARRGFPSMHVVVPKYWETMAAYLNSSTAPRGSLLVLPPDDFYQMPYTWYYGSDGFIVNLLDRHVVVPSGQGYGLVSSELLSSVRIEAAALVSHNWSEASRLLNAMRTPNVLVRSDIKTKVPGRTIVSPRILTSSLASDPDMHLIRQFGALSLYSLNSQHRQPPTQFATTSQTTPNLRSLALLPRQTALVSSPPQIGHEVVVPVALPLAGVQKSSSLVNRVTLPSPSHWTFHVAYTGIQPRNSPLTVTISRSANGQQAATVASALGKTLISNGDFRHGGWGAVGNCFNLSPVHSVKELGGRVSVGQGPNGSPALTLHASVGAACESTLLDWRGGSFFLRYSARSLSGSAPRICLWEEPVSSCAPTQATSSSATSPRSAWVTNSSIVTPDSGTKTITLFVYAFAAGQGKQTITQYANVVIRPIALTSEAFLIGLPKQSSHFLHLIVGSDGYSSSISSPLGSVHVAVDGLRNGWLVTRRLRNLPSIGSYASSYTVLEETLSFTTAMLLLAASLLWIDRKRKISKGPGWCN